MTDLSSAITPKSDQLNSDDLIGGPRTITVTRVTVRDGEQPVSIHFTGDGGKPYKPCKSMCRVLVLQWGPNGDRYVGRSMTLYREPKVTWAGMEVGGIRISHLSDIPSDAKMSLTETRNKRGIYTVKKLEQPSDTGAVLAAISLVQLASTIAEVEAAAAANRSKRWSRPEQERIRDAIEARKRELNPTVAQREPGEEG